MSHVSFAIFVSIFLLHSNVSAGNKSRMKTYSPKTVAKKTTAPSKKAAKKTVKKKGKTVTIIIETSMGTMEAELWPEKAPDTVANFLKYTDEKFFDNTVFHRVIPGFMIQGGGFTTDMKQKPTHDKIKNEATNGEKNLKGTLAMARTMDIHSATSQFFINHADNAFLDHRGTAGDTFGYAVFGKVTKGDDVIEKIAKVATGDFQQHQNVPKESLIIKSIRKK